MKVYRELRALAGVLLLTSTALAQSYFDSRLDYLVGRNPRTVSIADLNRDGELDLAVANSYSTPNTISVLFGNGDGTFDNPVFFEVGDKTGPCFEVSADVNGDDAPDLIVSNYNTNSISILLNNGDGTFASAHEYPVGGQVLIVNVADVNGDGQVELLAPLFNFDSVAVLLNDGLGGFLAASRYAAGVHPYAALAANCNSDNWLDLIVVNEGDYPLTSGTVSIFLNDGGGGFADATSYPVQDDPLAACAADLDGDGDVDIAVANQNSYSVSILRGHGDGTFDTASSYPAGFNPVSIVNADIDQDGLQDLIVANKVFDSVSVLLNLGGATFGTPEGFGVGSYPSDVRAADFNGDAHIDLAVTNSAGGSVSILMHNAQVICFDSDYDGFGDPGHPENTCLGDNCPSTFNPDQADWNDDGIGNACTPTDTGSLVTVQPAANTTITYDSVSQGGTTGVTTSTSGPYPPSNFNLLGSYYHITTSVAFEDTVTICIVYADSEVVNDESLIHLMHYVGSSWVDITSSLDTATNTICGKTTSFSFFALLGPCCIGMRGNVDLKGVVDLSDLSALIAYLTGGGYYPPCMDAANVNGLGVVDLSDLSALIAYLTGGGYQLLNCS